MYVLMTNGSNVSSGVIPARVPSNSVEFCPIVMSLSFFSFFFFLSLQGLQVNSISVHRKSAILTNIQLGPHYFLNIPGVVEFDILLVDSRIQKCGIDLGVS